MEDSNIIDRLVSGTEGITPDTARFMRAVGKRLDGAGVIDDVDEGGLRMLMMSYDMYIKASAALMRHGPILYDKRGRMSVNPAEKLAKTYYAQVLAFMREYGLTIRSRERIKALAPSEDDQSELYKFLTARDDG